MNKEKLYLIIIIIFLIIFSAGIVLYAHNHNAGLTKTLLSRVASFGPLLFFDSNESLRENKKYITKKCQTITYFGLKKNEIENFLNNSNLLGIDRIVPIGKGLEIDTVWDGYDTINSLSRIINLE